jgi:hypothetical protein
MNKLRVIIGLILGMILPALLLFHVSALSPVKYEASASTGAACSSLTVLDPNNDCSHGGTGFTSVISVVVQIISYIAGIIGVVMLIIGGFKFLTSGGDSQATASARSTVIFALIGLLVAAFAQVIVHFVIFNATCSTDKTQSNYSSTCHTANG